MDQVIKVLLVVVHLLSDNPAISGPLMLLAVAGLWQIKSLRAGLVAVSAYSRLLSECIESVRTRKPGDDKVVDAIKQAMMTQPSAVKAVDAAVNHVVDPKPVNPAGIIKRIAVGAINTLGLTSFRQKVINYLVK